MYSLTFNTNLNFHKVYFGSPISVSIFKNYDISKEDNNVSCFPGDVYYSVHNLLF